MEPANATASGVNLPELQLALSRQEALTGLRFGRPAVRTHSSLAILLGTAAYKRTRKAGTGELRRLIAHRGPYDGSRDWLTPVLRDPPSLIPLAAVAARTLLLPHSPERLATAAVRAYAITRASIEKLASAADRTG